MPDNPLHKVGAWSSAATRTPESGILRFFLLVFRRNVGQKKRLPVLSSLLTLWHYLPASMSCSLTNRKMPDSATCEGIFSKKGL